jgi:hypothetical protein
MDSIGKPIGDRISRSASTDSDIYQVKQREAKEKGSKQIEPVIERNAQFLRPET